MRFSSEDYQRVYSSIQLKYHSQNPDVARKGKELADQEYAFVLMQIASQPSACPAVLGGLDKPLMKSLNSMMGDRFYDWNVVNTLGCKIQALFHPVSNKSKMFTVSQIAHSQVTGLTRIGDDSAFGYALLGGIDGVNDLFVIKTPTKNSDGSDIYNERFITEFGTNQLRHLGVPNYAMSYGHLLCSRPIIDTRTKQVVEFCSPNSTEQVPYLIYENIKNSVSSTDYIINASSTQILSLYLQVLFASRHAAKVCGFTHQDLHPGNVLMRNVEGFTRAFQIPIIRDDGNTIYLLANSVATIIDFGLSTIIYEGKVRGNLEVLPESVGRTRDVVWPMGDAYKFLMFIGMYCRDNGNIAGFRQAQQIYKFFNAEDMSQNIDLQFDLRFILPYQDGVDIDDLIKFVINDCGGKQLLSATKRPNTPTLECQTCGTIGISQTKMTVPTTIIELMDVLPYIERHYPVHVQRILNSFNYTQAKSQLLTKLGNLQAKIESLLTLVEVPVPTTNLMTFPVMSTVQSLYYNLFQLINYIESLNIYISALNWSVVTFKDAQLSQTVDQLTSSVSNYKARCCNVVANCIKLSYIIQNQLTTEYAAIAINNDVRLKWYSQNYSMVRILDGSTCSPKALLPSQWVVEHSKNDTSPETMIENHRKRKQAIRQRLGL